MASVQQSLLNRILAPSTEARILSKIRNRTVSENALSAKSVTFLHGQLHRRTCQVGYPSLKKSGER